MGFVYVIKNCINDKVYVGQTKNSIEQRFNEHLYASMKKNTTNKLYMAMKELGKENFYIELLTECKDVDMNKYEQLYVEKFNSIKQGYNTVYHCSSISNSSNTELEDKIIELYKEGYSLASIGKTCEVSHATICKILRKNKMKREETSKANHVSGSKQVVMYSKDFVPEKLFDSIKEAYNWLKKNTEFKVTTYAVYAYIDVACKNYNICYGHRWQLLSDLSYDNKYFRSVLDKEDYKNGKQAYKPTGKDYYVVDDALKYVIKSCEKNYCLDCGKEISRNSTRCVDCFNTYRSRVNKGLEDTGCKCLQCGKAIAGNSLNGLCNSCANVKAKGKTRKASKEELKLLLGNNVPVTEIAKQFDRTPSTVHYWIKSYGLR